MKTIRFGILLLVAFLFIFYFYKVRAAFKKCTQPVTATYIGVGPGLGKSFGHTLLFSYDYNGTHYDSAESMTSQNIFHFKRNKMDQAMTENGYTIGQEYTIYVNPDQPKAFIADTKSTYRSLTLASILIILIIVLEILMK